MNVIKSHTLVCQSLKFPFQVSAIMGRMINALKMVFRGHVPYTYPILGPLVPLFWISVTSPLGFKARMGSALFAF